MPNSTLTNHLLPEALTRRHFLQLAALGATGIIVAGRSGRAYAQSQTPL